MNTPRISVVITCFNLGAYLPETLSSIATQTFTDFEICIVDDGSTDPVTLRLLEQLRDDVPVVRTENRGLSAARNLGVSRTSGEFICAVDADDILAPTLFEKSVARLDADPSLAFVSHWLEAFGDETWDWRPERCDLPTLLDVNTVNGAALVRREAVEAVGGWDESMRDGCEDWDFWITLVERGYKGDIIPEVLFRYRRRCDSMSRLKFAGDRFSTIYSRLVEKHVGSYVSHLAPLLARRVADTMRSRALADRLEEQMELDIRPARSRAQADLETTERSRAEESRISKNEIERLQTQIEVLQREHAALAAELTTASAQAAHSRLLTAALTQEVQALRSSWSWRVTGPLRMAAAWTPWFRPRRA